MRHFFVFTFLLLSLSGFSQDNITLTISAKNKQGNKIEGVEVSFLNVNKLIEDQQNDKLVYNNLAKGYYELLVSAEGYASVI
jgi:hypothetical protein